MRNRECNEDNGFRRIHHHPSHLPNFRYSSNVHFRLGFASPSPFSLAFPLPVSTEEALDVLGRGWLTLTPALPLWWWTAGSELAPDRGLSGTLPVSLGEDPCEPLSPGSFNLYHPPVYVNATSWYSKCVGSCSSTAACIQPTTHLSSSAIPLDWDLIEVDDKAIWDCCDGILYVAYDHSEPNILNGCGRKGVRGENLECRFLKLNQSGRLGRVKTKKDIRCTRSGY